LIAHYAVTLFHEAGVPTDVLQFLPGSGRTVGAALVADPRLDGVMFTGSTDTARSINQTLAKRTGSIVPFVAETGGQNVMIVDSSALAEQVTADVIYSAFDSAGQRCSALRVLFVQEDIADALIDMIVGAMKELVVSDPQYLTTDVGPVIDEGSLSMLRAHVQAMKREATLLYECDISAAPKGTYLAPTAFELKHLSQLTQEVFGPLLHIIRYKAKHIDDVIQQINDTGFGLTLGIHSRIAQFAQSVERNTRVGNTYVNRDMIGAVVGVQPIGGEGLSGTGPKAGGPNYLFRLCSEKTLSVNTTAAGGNASLLTLSEE
jgi:RHH-type proline utilization regulon transcriptional repressor/proline dehydrogenase/delta 1-pyrroline-5-carboxylate dehydrogenase